jgi:hypothetical protein
MAVLVALLLFAIGWWLISEGTQFFGFLAIVAGILALLSNPPKVSAKPRSSPSSAPSYYPPPVIVRSSPSPPRQDIKLKIKEPWFGTTPVEDFFSGLGDVVLFPVRIAWRLLRIGGGGKKK